MINNDSFIEINKINNTNKMFFLCASDIPGPPEGPVEISDIDSDACSLSWNKPLEDGGSNITNYVVEKCDVNRGDWVTAVSSCSKTSCRLGKLIPGKEYVFRIRAENRFGVSDSIQSGRMVAKFPFGEFHHIMSPVRALLPTNIDFL